MNPSNYSSISFPSLGLEVDPARSFSLGPLTIHYYGLIIGLGLLLAVIYGCRRSKEFGIKEDHIIDGVLWITPFAILCARAYYCIFSWSDFAADPVSVFYIWKGGLAIYGGVIGAVVGIAVFCRIKKISMPALLDLVLLGFLIGQSLGRWGNFFNREAFGAPTESFLRMGLYNTRTGTYEYYHPTFLYESLWNLAGFLLLHFLSRKRKYDGQIALGYAAWYGLGRALIEGLRMDSLYIGPFRVSQLLAAVSCFAAVGILVFQSFRSHDPKALYANRAAEAEVPAPEAEDPAPEAEDMAVSPEEAQEVPEENTRE